MILKKLIPNQLRYSKLSQTVKPLCYAVALSMVALPVNAGRNNLGDLEIYKAAESGGAVLTLMLDTSGSMSTKDFSGGDSRLTILIKALTELLSKKDASGNYTLSSNNIIGLGQYSVDKDGNGAVDGKAGSILVPARKLDEVQRAKLIATLTGFRASGLTPAANAYAEAGAYMMGTTTVELEEEDIYQVLGRVYETETAGKKPYKYTLQECTSNYSEPTYYGGRYFYFCKTDSFSTVKTYEKKKKNSLSTFDKNANAKISKDINDQYEEIGGNVRYYSKKVNKSSAVKDTDESGYTVSTQEAKDATNNYLNYNAPVSDSQCSGYGIYFLTDGVPNGSSNSTASGLMNLSLKGHSSSLSLDGTCSGGLSNVNGSTGWACMGEYSKKLRDVTNPSKRSILTATVGFGKEFAGIKTSVDGTGKTVYHCDESASSSITPSDHVKNLCKLGSEAYGGGGFYYTTDADSLAASVTSFTAKLTQIIETAPSGTITIPNDPLSSTNLQPFAYLPTAPSLSAFSAFNCCLIIVLGINANVSSPFSDDTKCSAPSIEPNII